MKRFIALLGLLASCSAFASGYVGDYAPGDTIDCNFGTVNPSTGASFTLAGTPAVSVYKDNSTTQSTSGVTLSADFDSVTGLNHVRVTTASDGTFYAAGSYFEAVITTGTVDSVSVTGQPVCAFTLNKVSSLRPTTAARTLDVSSTGEAGIDWANIGSPTTSVSLSGTTVSTVSTIASAGISEASYATTAGSFKPLGILDQGTAQSATSTTLVLRSAASFADDTAIGMTIVACGSTQGYCQSRAVTDYVGSTDTATVDTWTVTPSGTITYYLFGTAPGSGSSAPTAATVADAVWDEARSGHVTSGTFGEYVPANLTNISGSAVSTSTAQLGVNVVNFGGSAGTFTTGQPTVRLSSGTGTGQISLSSGTVTAGTVSDKTGYALSAAGVDAVWDEATSGHTTAGTYGKAVSDVLTATGTTIPAAVDVIDGIVDQLLIGVNVSKMNGVTLCGAGTSGDLFRTGC